MTPSTRRLSRGFTLIEVLVALLILTAVILTSLGVFVDRVRRMAEASEMSLAWQALANEAEAQRRHPFETLAPEQTVPFLTDPGSEGALEGAEGTVTVTQAGADVRALALRIEWRNGSRTAETIVYRTFTGGGDLW